MKIINREIVRNTDTKYTLKSDNVLFKDLDFYCDLAYNNVTSAVFVFTRLSDNLVAMFLPKEETADMPLGTHKGTLLMKDATGLIHPLRELVVKVSINRTEVI